MPLSDAAIRNAKPKATAYKLADTAGLYVHIAPSGSKLWRMKYRVHGKEKTLSIGAYPDVGLAEARQKRDSAKAELAAGKDPSREKQRRAIVAKMESANTFALIAAEFIDHKRNDGEKAWSRRTAEKKRVAG